MSAPRNPTLLPRERLSWPLGVAAMVVGVGLATGAIEALRHGAPVISLSVVYLVPILVVSAYWGIILGLSTAVLSALSFNFFFLDPTGRFTIADSRNWAALLAFLGVALVTSTSAESIRARADEAEQRRREADLGAELARTVLGSPRLSESLAMVSRRLAELLDARSASVELGTGAADERRIAIPLMSGEARSARWSCPPICPVAGGARARADRARAGVGGRRRAGARAAAGRRRRDRGPAPQRRHEDRAAALGLPRPAHAGDRDARRKRRAALGLGDR